MIVHSNRAREAYKDVPVIIGGIEASLRRLGHYDYWSDKVRRSILLDAKADLLIYGMGEKAVVEIAEALEAGIDISDITWINGTCYKAKSFEADEDTESLPDFDEIVSDKDSYCRSFLTAYRNNDYVNGKRLVEKYTDSVYVIQKSSDAAAVPSGTGRYLRARLRNEWHPIYDDAGGICVSGN